jgi:hypothetical protein
MGTSFNSFSSPTKYWNVVRGCEDVFKAIDNIQYQEGGTTDVAKAFDKVRNDMFKQPKGDRDFARNYILLLTGNWLYILVTF